MLELPDLGSNLPDIVLRTTVVYLFVVAAIRISGKREVGQMSVLELVVILVISDAVQNSMIGENTTLWGGLVAVVTLLSLDFAINWVTGRSRRWRNVIKANRASWSATGACSRRRFKRRRSMLTTCVPRSDHMG